MKQEFKSRPIDMSEVGTSPDQLIWQSWTDTFSIPADKVRDIQMEALQNRFSQMMAGVPTLASLAEENGITRLERFEDAAPLLFPHSFYKSYPLSFIENARFDRLTRWLDNLTCHDISDMDTEGVDCIDDWIDRLDRDTPLRVLHTSGTSGKLSFMPRSTSEVPHTVRGWRLNFEGFGTEADAAEIEGMTETPIIAPAYRKGAIGICRMLDAIVGTMFDGDESMVHALNPGRLSADLMSLAGRLSAAEAQGELGRNRISPALLARREKFMEEQRTAPERARAFFGQLAEELGGKRVAMPGSWLQLNDFAESGRAAGHDRLFRNDSLIWTAGGTKGRAMPPDFKRSAAGFFGVPKVHEGYGMTELSIMMPMCPAGHYHTPPWTILYLLDPKNGEQLPRTGTQTGRLGFIDLVPVSFWGGILSGDRVTVNWADDRPCSCGRIGPYVHDDVRRYSEIEGGDDKITCAGAPEAIDRALTFLTDME